MNVRPTSFRTFPDEEVLEGVGRFESAPALEELGDALRGNMKSLLWGGCGARAGGECDEEIWLRFLETAQEMPLVLFGAAGTVPRAAADGDGYGCAVRKFSYC